MPKGFFLCAVHGEVAGLRGAQSPPFLGQPSALLAFSSESVSHQGWERGKVSSISESWKGAAASLRSPTSPCGSQQCGASMCMYVCLCNESPHHCLLPSLLLLMEPFTWAAACWQPSSKMGRGEGRIARGNSSRTGESCCFLTAAPHFPLFCLEFPAFDVGVGRNI